jgi:DNA invertase Pin-like site-specific DNA recombinase
MPRLCGGLVVWKLDRLGRNLHHLINTVHDLTARAVGLKVLTGQGAAIDTTTPAGNLVFGIFAALAEFERELISERTTAGLAPARARGRKGGRPFKLTPAKLRLATASVGQPDTKIRRPMHRARVPAGLAGDLPGERSRQREWWAEPGQRRDGKWRG